MIRPTNGVRLGREHRFEWSTGEGVSEYYFRAGTCHGCADIYDGSMGRQTHLLLTIPRSDRVFVTLFSFIHGAWYWNEYEYLGPIEDHDPVRVVRINVTNHLRYAARISVNGVVEGSVPAGETRFVEATVRGAMHVSWSLVRPMLSGRELGDSMGGSFAAIANPVGPYNYGLDNIIADDQFFMPSITNRTAAGMLLEVNGGLSSQNRCGCLIPANGNNVAAGYYRLFSNSNVRLYRSGSGYTGPYIYWGTAENPLHRHVEEKTGVARLTATRVP
jgi:hypothetical protein